MTHFPATRGYRVRVRALRQLSPHFLRVTFTDESLVHFGTDGLDQRIKIMFPLPDGSFTDIGMFDEPAPELMEWYKRWRMLDDDKRNPMRTYTVRAIRAEQREIDVDFVLHGITGSGSAWAERAEIGDEVIIAGPDARGQRPTLASGGIDFNPGEARNILLAGDETAAPAILAVLSQLSASAESSSYRGAAFIEVLAAEDFLENDFTAPENITVHWLARDDAEHGVKLSTAVSEHAPKFFGDVASSEDDAYTDPTADEILWDTADPQAIAQHYAWLAGEATCITGIRRHLVKQLGISRKFISFMGYWRIGRAEN